MMNPIPLQTPGVATTQGDDGDWPALAAPNAEEVAPADWELVPPPPRTAASLVRFSSVATNTQPNHGNNRKVLVHCQSSPDLRQYSIVEDDDDDDVEDVEGNEEDDFFPVDSDEDLDEGAATEDFSLVSGPGSVMTASTTASTPGKLSFRDMMLKSAAASNDSEQTSQQQHQQQPRRRKMRRPRFQVVQPTTKTMKRCSKSTGDLLSLAHGAATSDDVLGETDAHEYYSRKAHGAKERQNGLKSRPDEAKRLQMTMAKKHMQKQRQGR